VGELAVGVAKAVAAVDARGTDEYEKLRADVINNLNMVLDAGEASLRVLRRIEKALASVEAPTPANLRVAFESLQRGNGIVEEMRGAVADGDWKAFFAVLPELRFHHVKAVAEMGDSPASVAADIAVVSDEAARVIFGASAYVTNVTDRVRQHIEELGGAGVRVLGGGRLANRDELLRAIRSVEGEESLDGFTRRYGEGVKHAREYILRVYPVVVSKLFEDVDTVDEGVLDEALPHYREMKREFHYGMAEYSMFLDSLPVLVMKAGVKKRRWF